VWRWSGWEALGAVIRYLLGTWIAARVSPDFPWSTLLINVSGSFLIGVTLGLASEGQLSAEARLFLAVGVLGGNTTFSTFSYESLELLADGSMANDRKNYFLSLRILDNFFHGQVD
jgi:CrcB protein